MEIAFYLEEFSLVPHVFHSYLPNVEMRRYFGYVRAWILNWLWFEVEVVRPYRERV